MSRPAASRVAAEGRIVSETSPPQSVPAPSSLEPSRPSIALRVACVLVLVSLALIGWAIVHPVPLAVIAAMSIGQGIGTVGAGIFAWIVVRDLRRALGARRSRPKSPPS